MFQFHKIQSIMSTFSLELLSSLLLLLLPLPSLVTANFRYHACESKNNYTANSSFEVNMQLIFQSLYSNTTTTTNDGFFNDTKGLGSNRVYGLAMCTGDVSMADCQTCLNSSAEKIIQKCPNNKAAVIWFDFCLLRYSDVNFFGKISETTAYLVNTKNVTNTTVFNQVLGRMLKGIINRAAFGPRQLSYPLMFAVNQTSYMDFQTVYGQVQCTRDLSNDNCNTCLTNELNKIPGSFNGKIGGTIYSGSCFLRYEMYSFYKESQPLAQPPSPLPPPAGGGVIIERAGKKKNSTTIVVAILVPVGVLVILFLFCYFWCIKRKKTMDYQIPSDSLEIVATDSLIFDLAIIKFVTNNFSESNKLGEGGFGAVYKGTLPDGREIAVKRLSSHSEQGVQELKNEISLLIRLQHRNLVRILGFCLEEDEKLLIYEYVNNRSLDTILNDPSKKQQLSWEERYNIIGGIARGLLYLHEESQVKIIHRDLKASNILLDSNLNPKIADFGLARMFDVDQTRAITNRIAGTFGYMAPEYVRRGHFSNKSDVFSFGVLVLEIVTGRMNNYNDDDEDSIDLQTYVWEHWCRRSISDIVDPTIGTNYSMSEALRCIEIGLLCLQESPNDRIAMSTVVVMLNSESVSFAAPSQPAFLTRRIGVRSIDDGSGGSHVDAGSHVLQDEDRNELSITELGPR